MKKLIATTLALALTAASLAGCSGTSDAGSQNAVDADKMSQTQTGEGPQVRVPVHRRRYELSPDPVHF